MVVESSYLGMTRANAALKAARRHHDLLLRQLTYHTPFNARAQTFHGTFITRLPITTRPIHTATLTDYNLTRLKTSEVPHHHELQIRTQAESRGAAEGRERTPEYISDTT